MMSEEPSPEKYTEQILVEYDKKFFLQDLEAFSLSMKKNDFNSANIFANRIMSNAYLFDKKYLGILGFFLRQIANEGIIMKRLNNIEGEDVVSEKSKSFISIIKSLAQLDEYDFNELWVEFNNFIIKIRRYHLLEEEKSAYKEPNFNFTNASFKKIIIEFEKDKDTLLHASNNLIKGILNEMNRIGKTHGTAPNEQCLLCVVTMLDRVDEYIGITSTSEKDFEKRMTKHIIPLIEHFFKIKSTSTEYVNDFNDYLWDLIKLWRSFYIQYMERAKATLKSKPEESNIQEPIKAKLVDEIAKGLEEEVGLK